MCSLVTQKSQMAKRKRGGEMTKTKVKVTMEIEVDDIEDFSKFIATVEKGVIKFSEETKANVLKVEVKEH